MTLENWLLFSSIALVATLSPGPAVLLVTSHSLQYGPFRSIFTILGNISALFVMSLCSVLGLSTIMLYSAVAFTLIKTIGAIYLIYLGIKLWREGITTDRNAISHGNNKSGFSLYSQGLVVALTNPKAIAFTTALFPQFVEVSEPFSGQFVLLVVTFMSFSFLCLLGYAFLSHTAQRRALPILSQKTTGRLFGSIFILSGAALASTTN